MKLQRVGSGRILREDRKHAGVSQSYNVKWKEKLEYRTHKTVIAAYQGEGREGVDEPVLHTVLCTNYTHPSSFSSLPALILTET